MQEQFHVCTVGMGALTYWAAAEKPYAGACSAWLQEQQKQLYGPRADPLCLQLGTEVSVFCETEHAGMNCVCSISMDVSHCWAAAVNLIAATL